MLEPSPIIAILRGVRPDEVVAVGEALVENGITRIEVPLNSPEAPLESISRLVAHFGDRAEIGAGTVLSVEAVDAVHTTGASYIVAPNCVPAVIARARALGMGAYPGVVTPTEAFAAIDAGATGLKIFPAEVVGPEGIREMRAVLPPDMPVYAVSGAFSRPFADYIAAGVSGFGLGGLVYSPGDTAEMVGAKARAAMALCGKEH